MCIRDRLEDVNLAGAKGILVNVTSGLDLKMGEFEEVGNTVKAFASDNATVVVGTVIDPNMNDEIRVTVVATGISTDNRKEEPVPTQAPSRPVAVATAPAPMAAPSHAPAPQRAERFEDAVEIRRVERPAAVPRARDDRVFQDITEGNTDYLDIPAFLRRQAD